MEIFKRKREFSEMSGITLSFTNLLNVYLNRDSWVFITSLAFTLL